MVQATVKYSEVKDSLKTGDLILFHGRLKVGEFIEVYAPIDFSDKGKLQLISGAELVDGPLIDISED